jgi:hypothetical protein
MGTTETGLSPFSALGSAFLPPLDIGWNTPTSAPATALAVGAGDGTGDRSGFLFGLFRFTARATANMSSPNATTGVAHFIRRDMAIDPFW